MIQELAHASGTPPELELVIEFAKKIYDQRPDSIAPISNSSGVDNHLFVLDYKERKKLLRMSCADNAIQLHKKEYFVSQKAIELGVNTPAYESLESLDKWSGISRCFLDGRLASGQKDQLLVWESIGEAAKKLHAFAYNGFGQESLYQESKDGVSLEHWIETELNTIAQDQSLLNIGVLSPLQRDAAIKEIESISNWKCKPKLIHGDFSLANAVIDPAGICQVIDWGNATAHRAPHYDLAEIYCWNKTQEWIAPVASGYQCTVAEIEDIIEESRPLILWRLLWALRRDVSRMPDCWQSAAYAQKSLDGLNKIMLEL